MIQKYYFVRESSIESRWWLMMIIFVVLLAGAACGGVMYAEHYMPHALNEGWTVAIFSVLISVVVGQVIAAYFIYGGNERCEWHASSSSLEEGFADVLAILDVYLAAHSDIVCTDEYITETARQGLREYDAGTLYPEHVEAMQDVTMSHAIATTLVDSLRDAPLMLFCAFTSSLIAYLTATYVHTEAVWSLVEPRYASAAAVVIAGTVGQIILTWCLINIKKKRRRSDALTEIELTIKYVVSNSKSAALENGEDKETIDEKILAAWDKCVEERKEKNGGRTISFDEAIQAIRVRLVKNAEEQ